MSDFNLHHLRESYPDAAANILRIYNGLDLDSFRYQAPRERVSLVLAVGRLVEKKGFIDLVDACAELSRLGCDFKCRIIGEGELEGVLRTRIESQGIGSVVELAGARPQTEVIELTRQAATLAAPCVVAPDGNRDGLPTVLLEAMALGTPCVSTDVTGIPEVIRNGETGLVVPQRDPQALAQALRRLFDDVSMRLRLAERARQLVESEFDIHINSRRLREVFGEVNRRREAV